jgi:hypothetical protein
MSDMGPMWPVFPAIIGTGWYWIVGGDPQVSIFLCNSPVALSFSIRSAWIWISLRSVDFEVPAHSRPWTFPGSEIWVDFVNMDGDVVDTLDPELYGLFQDPGCGVADGDSTGYECDLLEGFPILGVDYLQPDALVMHGLGVTPWDIDNINMPGRHEHLGVPFYGNDYYQGDAGTDLTEMMDFDLPTRIDPGEYTFNVYTHGYVMRRSFPFQIPQFGHADIEADLIQGGQIRVCIDFFHEGIETAFNGFIRVEVFNEDEELVGASIYGQAEPNPYTKTGLGGAYLPYVPMTDWLLASLGGNTETGAPEAAEGSGLGDLNGNGVIDVDESGRQRGDEIDAFALLPLGQTWANYEDTDSQPGTSQDPLDANRNLLPPYRVTCFDVYGFHDYYGNPARTWAGGWPTTDGAHQDDYGLMGSVDIPGWEGSGGGLYSVKVWAFDPTGPDWIFNTVAPIDDWRMYQMQFELTNIEVPWGGSITLASHMHNMAQLKGTVRWLDMFGNLRALPWAQISADPGPGTDDYPAYAAGLGPVGALAPDSAGTYIMWVPAGAHDVSVSTSTASQVWSSSAPTSQAEYTAVVSDGWIGGGDSQLSASGVPVPEIPAFMAPLGLFAALAASIWLLRRKTVNAPLLMK